MVMAFLELSKLLLSNCGYALCIASYLQQLGMSASFTFFSWIIVYAVITIFDSMGIRQSKNIQILFTSFCTLTLFIYAGSCLTQFHVDNVVSGGLVKGTALDFIRALPFSLQFFLGFEEIPLLLTYTRKPDVTIPRAVRIACGAMVVIGVFVLVSGAGVSNYMDLISNPAPLMVGFNIVYGADSNFSYFAGISIIVAIVNNFFAFALYSSQQSKL